MASWGVCSSGCVIVAPSNAMVVVAMAITNVRELEDEKMHKSELPRGASQAAPPVGLSQC